METPPTPTNNRPVCRAEGVLSNPVQDRAVLYCQDECKAIVLNSTGAALWDALESPRRPSDLAALLIKRFPHLTPDRAREDVDAFLDRLLSESILRALP